MFVASAKKDVSFFDRQAEWETDSQSVVRLSLRTKRGYARRGGGPDPELSTTQYG